MFNTNLPDKRVPQGHPLQRMRAIVQLLMQQLNYNLLFRWFVGLSMDDAVWDASTFSKNRERLLAGDIAVGFFHLWLAATSQHMERRGTRQTAILERSHSM